MASAPASANAWATFHPRPRAPLDLESFCGSVETLRCAKRETNGKRLDIEENVGSVKRLF